MIVSGVELSSRRMKLLSVTFAYLVIALVLGLGIYLTTLGHLWLLVLGGLVYVLLFATYGCRS